MASRSAAALLLLLGVATASAAGPPLRVLGSSGVVIDDLPIARFERPGRLGDGRLVFRGVSTSLVRVVDGQDVPYARTGDTLPAPLDGTLNEIVDLAANAAGTIAVAAEVNSSQATGVILVDDGTGPKTAVTHGGDDALAGVAIDAASDLLYWTSAALYLRSGGAVPEVIGTLPRPGRLRLRPLLADGPAAAWVVDSSRGASGVTYWSPSTGSVPVAGGRFKRTSRVQLGLAIDARFGVAYLRGAGSGSARGAFLWSVASGTTAKIAGVGVAVGDRSIWRFRGPLVFEDDGAVAFEADLRGPRATRRLRTFVRAKDGVLTPIDAPAGPPASGPTLRLDRQGALFAVDGDVVTPLVRPGDPVVGSGIVASVESHVARGDGVAAVVTLREGGEAVVRRRGARLVSLRLDPDLGVSLSSALPEVTSHTTALFADGSVLVGRKNLTTTKVPKRLAADFFVQGIVGGDRLLALGTFGACEGVFVAQGRRLVSLLRAGPAPGCGRRPPLASIDALAASGGTVVVLGNDAQAVPGLYRVRRRGVARLRTEVGTFPVAPLAVALAGERPVFVAYSPEDPELRQVFLAGTPDATPLVREGDPTPIGRIGFEEADVFGSSSGEEILLTARVRDGSVRRALVAQRLPR